MRDAKRIRSLLLRRYLAAITSIVLVVSASVLYLSVKFERMHEASALLQRLEIHVLRISYMEERSIARQGSDLASERQQLVDDARTTAQALIPLIKDSGDHCVEKLLVSLNQAKRIEDLRSRISDVSRFLAKHDEKLKQQIRFTVAFELVLFPILAFLFFQLISKSFAVLRRTMVSRKELTKSESLLETVLAGMVDGIVTTDMQGKVLYINRTARRLMGLEGFPDVIGKNIQVLREYYQFFDENGVLLPGDQMPISQAMKGMSRLPVTLRIRTKRGGEGSDRWASFHTIAFCDDEAGLSVIISVFRETTEQRRSEALMEQQRGQLAHSARLSSVGVMAAGIAHEINNPLAVIQRRAEQIMESIEEGNPDPAQTRIYAEKIVKFSKRISKIIRSLKSISRDGANDPFEKVSIKTLIEDCLELCQEKFRHRGVELLLDVPTADVQLECRSTQISQVLLNLLSNGLDAAESVRGGEAQKWVKIAVEVEAGQVLIRVSDSGPGIPQDLRHKVGVPFFTTKEAGKGTGLGLSVSRQIVQLHHGALTLESKAGPTCMIVRLPQVQSASGENPLDRVA